jgi:RNA-binding protein Musashi
MEEFDDNRIFIGKIPSSIPNDKLEKYFGQFGPVAHVLAPRPNGPFKIAFVTYVDKQAMEKALEHRHELGGQELNVTKALPKAARGDTKKETRIFVGQIPAGTAEEELEGYFSKWGKVTRVNIPSQPPKDKIYAFVTYSSSQEKFSALASKHIFKGTELKVVEAAPKPPPSDRGAASAGPGMYGVSGYGAPRGAPMGYPGMSAPAPAPTQDFEENPTRIFVGRIPTDTSVEELKDYFGRFGNVVDVHLPSPKSQAKRNEAKGSYAFITFSTSKEVFKTIAASPHTFKDQRVEVIEAKPKGVRGSADAPPVPAESRIFVGRIPQSVNDDQIRQYFGQYGKVNDVHRPKQTAKEGLEFAFVILGSSQDVARVLAEDKHLLLGKFELNVVRARPRGPTGSQSAAGGGSSGGPPRGRSSSRDGSRAQSYRDPDPRDDYGYGRGSQSRAPPAPAPFAYPEPAYDPYRGGPGPAAPAVYDPYAPQPAYAAPSGGYSGVGNGSYAAVAPSSLPPAGYYDPYAAQGYAPAPSAMSQSKHRFQPY